MGTVSPGRAENRKIDSIINKAGRNLKIDLFENWKPRKFVDIR